MSTLIIDRRLRPGRNSAANPGNPDGTQFIPESSRAELHRRLESLRAGLATLEREHQLADAAAFEDTMSVLNDEIADLLAVVMNGSQGTS